ncbi:uncharacterized protein LOC135217039 [Macrobrachium nipponense]|uniref:uncharacterized protein LOC135217039 n=1 Tax=Macrobrachium nipponense TaxID=159736 RepID=UPI0030C86750
MCDSRMNFLVGNCCFCFSLRTGSYIIASLSLALFLILAVTGVYFAITTGNASILWIAVGVYLLDIGLALMLFYGVRQKKRILVVTWVWLTLILMGLALIVLILSVALAKISLLHCILGFLTIVVHLYFTLVVRSYGHDMREGQLENTA